MARIGCKCGRTMWNGETPNDIEFHVMSDRRLCDIQQADSIGTVEMADSFDYNVWRCPDCGRLYVYDDKGSSALFVYTIEEESEI